MENEIVHIAKIIAWPKMRQSYEPFLPHIVSAITSVELQVCMIAIRTNFHEMPDVKPPLEGGCGPALDWLSESALRLANKALMTSNGRISAKPGNLSKTLLELSEACERLERYGNEDRVAGENALRAWLQRGLINAAYHTEPIAGRAGQSSDPLAEVVPLANQLREMPLAYASREDELTFPLASLDLVIKPKTPTGIEPFDRGELEGGAEEDTCMILAGESNIGKSHLGLFTLSSISLFKREPTVLCSGEDSIDTTKRRVFAHFLRIPDSEMIKLSLEEREKRMIAAYGNPENPESDYYHLIHNFAICCIPEGKFTPKAILDKIDASEQKTQRKVKAFMADYLQKMNENAVGRNMRRQRDEELEFTVNQTKEICQDKKTFGLIISQVPSHAAGGTFEFLNLKQAVARSYAATWGAHYVVTMNRTTEETKRLAGGSDKRPRLNLFLCKNKVGPLGMCYALGNPEKAHWEFFRSKPDLVARTENVPERSEFEPKAYLKQRETPLDNAARGKV